MKLINQTPVPAEVIVSEIGRRRDRLGTIVAKATFRFREGVTELESEDPFPILRSEEQTELGLLPRDIFLRLEPVFEVLLLGKAHAPEGSAVQSRMVSLSVGSETRELMVYGDRTWLRTGDEWSLSAAQPFSSMPMTWSRAHGGACEIEIDRESFVEVADPWNRHGRGFDAEQMAAPLVEVLRPPPPYPVFHHTRQAPNLEDPAHLIRTVEDAPRPLCWATVPMDCGLLAARWIPGALDQTGRRLDYSAMQRYVEANSAGTTPKQTLLFAHPSWIIDRPQPGSQVTLQGLTAAGDYTFPLPQIRILADYVMGDRTGQRELVPQLLVLLPEQQRLYIVYRSMFAVEYGPALERSFRLRLEQGWYGPVGEPDKIQDTGAA